MGMAVMTIYENNKYTPSLSKKGELKKHEEPGDVYAKIFEVGDETYILHMFRFIKHRKFKVGDRLKVMDQDNGVFTLGFDNES